MSTNEIARQAMNNFANWMPEVGKVLIISILIFLLYIIVKPLLTCQCGKWFWQRHEK